MKSLLSFPAFLIHLFHLLPCLNSQFRPQTTHPSHRQHPKAYQPLLNSQNPPPDQSDLIYDSYIETLLQNQQFTSSLIQSISNVFYNRWLLNLSKPTQKKYLQILLTTIHKDQISQFTSQDHFLILTQIFQHQEMTQQFLKYLQFDFTSKSFVNFITQSYGEQKNTDFSQLKDEDKARIYLLALRKQDELENGKNQEQIDKDQKKKIDSKQQTKQKEESKQNQRDTKNPEAQEQKPQQKEQQKKEENDIDKEEKDKKN